MDSKFSMLYLYDFILEKGLMALLQANEFPHQARVFYITLRQT
jgi:hypothetical protein